MENAIESKNNSFLSLDSLHNPKDERKNSQDYSKTHSKKCEAATKEKHLTGFLKQSFRTLSVPKKSQTEKEKIDSSKFFGEGITFKAKLIGILEVDRDRGEQMCQESLLDLKMAVRAAGEHKQRINIVVNMDGVRLRDEKTGDCLHHHPVHKISFIMLDGADSRAFGYVFGSPDTNHRFFGIKTDKSAVQAVKTINELFQVVYELKKREVEVARQNIEQHQLKYGSSLFLENMPSTKAIGYGSAGSAGSAGSGSSGTSEFIHRTLRPFARDDSNKNAKNRNQTANVIADLMDLEMELNSLQQGLSQMERLTPCDPFGPSPSLPKEDPFGDSFTPPPCITTPPPTKLPPPPTASDRRKVGSTSSTASQPELHWFDKETQDLFTSEKNLSSTANDSSFDKDKKQECGTVARTEVTSGDLYDIFTDLDPLGTGRSKPYMDKKDFFQELKNPPKRQLRDLKGSESGTDGNNLSTCFTGTSKSLFLEDRSEKLYSERYRKYRSVDSAPASAPPSDHRITLAEELAKCDAYYDSSSASAVDPFETSFANFAAFGSQNGSAGGFDLSPPSLLQEEEPRRSPASHADASQHHSSLQNILNSGRLSSSSSNKSVYKPALSVLADDLPPAASSQTTESSLQRNSATPPSWNRLADDSSKQKIVINLRKVLSNADDTDKENDSPVLEEAATILRNPDAMSPARGGGGGDVSSDSFESIPEPPPRPITSPVVNQPPPLPPKKLQLPMTMKPPPPRPSSSDALSHYDYIENYQSLGSRQQQQRLNGDIQIPPLPAPARKPKFGHEHDRDTVARHRPHKQAAAGLGRASRAAESDYYLTPISRSKEVDRCKPKPSLNITISQLTSTGFEDLAAMLRIPASALSKMTLKELTECLSRLSDAECQKLEQDMNHKNQNNRYEDARHKYRSLNESFDAGEDDSPGAVTFEANFEERFPPKDSAGGTATAPTAQVDKYAVFRELIEQEEKNSTALRPCNDVADTERGQDTEVELHAHEQTENAAAPAHKTRGSVDGTASAESAKEVSASEQEEKDKYAALRTISVQKAAAEAKSDSGTGQNAESGSRGQDEPSTLECERENDTAGEEDEDKTDGDSGAIVDGAVGGNGDTTIDENEPTLIDKGSSGSGEVNADAEIESRSIEEDAQVRSAGELGQNWAKFDSEQDAREEQRVSDKSPWRDENKNDNDFAESKQHAEPARVTRCRKKDQRRKGWNQVRTDFDEDDDEEDEGMVEEEEYNAELEEDEDYGDDSEEENWESPKRSVASSWDESSWRENGWSDRDSLYDDAEVSPAPTASSYRLQPPYAKKGYHRKFAAPPKKSAALAEHSPWEEESPGWPRKPAYKEYGAKLESERVYGERKMRTPPWSGGSSGGDRKRYEPKGEDEDEEDELTLLKMMLGKKRLKALEEQLFKHYREQLSEASLPAYYSHRTATAAAASVAAAKIAAKQEYGREKVTGGGRNYGKKYYTAQRPKSADKGRKPLSLRPEDTEELFATNSKKYRRPRSQDELSISEEERWSHKSPPGFKRPAGRSRHQSQTSPFEDNFAPHAYEFAGETTPPPETATPSAIVSSRSKNSQQQPPPSSSSRYKKATMATTESKKQQHSADDEPVSYPRYDSKNRCGYRESCPQQSADESFPYSSFHLRGSGRESCQQQSAEELVPYPAFHLLGNSRESSRRQSPFEDDFTPPDTNHQQMQQPPQYVSDCGGGKDGGGSRRSNDDSLFAADSTVGRSSRGTLARTSRANRYEHARRTGVGSGASAPTEKSTKYYENVELWKKTPSTAAAGSGSVSESYYEKVTMGKDKYKHAPPAKESNGGESPLSVGGDTRSPRKSSRPSESRRHDPFNDNAATGGYDPRTVPRLQKAKSKNKIQTYDSGSDSTETGRTGVAAAGAATSAAAAVKWKEDLPSFAFSEQQQHSRK